MNSHRQIGLEQHDGDDVGRDPRSMSADELKLLGHARVSPLRALRLKCLDCCNESAQEVRLCTAVDCASWPFRLGKNPWRRKLDPQERAALQARLVPNGASESTAAQKTGSEIAASDFDRVRVPNDTAVEIPPAKQGAAQGGVS
jgi:hypothetical protein